jgi:hypothetical protein
MIAGIDPARFLAVVLRLRLIALVSKLFVMVVYR